MLKSDKQLTRAFWSDLQGLVGHGQTWVNSVFKFSRMDKYLKVVTEFLMVIFIQWVLRINRSLTRATQLIPGIVGSLVGFALSPWTKPHRPRRSNHCPWTTPHQPRSCKHSCGAMSTVRVLFHRGTGGLNILRGVMRSLQGNTDDPKQSDEDIKWNENQR